MVFLLATAVYIPMSCESPELPVCPYQYQDTAKLSKTAEVASEGPRFQAPGRPKAKGMVEFHKLRYGQLQCMPIEEASCENISTAQAIQMRMTGADMYHAIQKIDASRQQAERCKQSGRSTGIQSCVDVTGYVRIAISCHASSSSRTT
jgi:hypothetical protein